MNTHDEGLLLSAFIDGALSEPEMAHLKEHLATCSPCRFELESLRGIKHRLASAPRRAFPPELLVALRDNCREDSSRNAPWKVILSVSRRGWASTGALALASLIIGLWLRQRPSEEAVPIEILAAAHSRYSAEGLIPGDLVASNFSGELDRSHAHNNDNQ